MTTTWNEVTPEAVKEAKETLKACLVYFPACGALFRGKSRGGCAGT